MIITVGNIGNNIIVIGNNKHQSALNNNSLLIITPNNWPLFARDIKNKSIIIKSNNINNRDIKK